MFLMICYYICAVITIFGYFYAFKKSKLKLVSFSTLSYLTGILFAILPGYFIASGYLALQFTPHLYRGFDLDVYFIYISFAILMPLGLFLGRLCGRNLTLHIPARSGSRKRLIIITGFVILYALAYFIWLPTIPLNSIVLGISTGKLLAADRSLITHGLGTLGRVPRAFGYWRAVLQPISFFIFLYWLNSFRISQHKRSFSKKKLYKIGFILFLFIFVAYCQLFSLEKAPIVYFMIAIIFNRLVFYDHPKMSRKEILLSIGVIFGSIIIMYSIFMEAQSNYILQVIVNRLMRQTAAVYDQIVYVKQNGFVFFDNMKMNYLNEDPVNISRWAFYRMSPESYLTGADGTTAGLSLANLYFSFADFGIFIFLLMMIWYGFVDSLFLGAIHYSGNSYRLRVLHVSIYATFSAYFMLYLLGNVFGIFQLPTIFARFMYPIVLFYTSIFKIESIRVIKPRDY